MSGPNYPPTERQCGARTRSGQPCRKWTIRGRSRCRNHGGLTPRGFASPHYKHGWFSDDPIHAMMRTLVLSQEEQERRVAKRLTAMGFVQDEHGDWHRQDTHERTHDGR